MKFIKLESIYGGSICFNIEDIILIEQYSKSDNSAKIYLKNYQYHINTKESPEEIYEMLVGLTK
jgi:hypothetical protein